MKRWRYTPNGRRISLLFGKRRMRIRTYGVVRGMVETPPYSIFKLAFGSDCIKNSVKFDKYKSYLEYQLMDSDKVVSEDTDLTLITFNCVKWSDDLDYVKAVWCFLNALDYFEMLIINDDYTTEYYADDYTRKYVGEGGTLLSPDIKVNVAVTVNAVKAK